MHKAGTCPVASGLSPLLDLDPEAIANESLYLDHLRAQGPVVWVDELEAFAVTRYDEVVEVLADPARFGSDIGNPRGPRAVARLNIATAELGRTSVAFHDLLDRLKPDWRAEPILLQTDGPRHNSQRKLVSRLFTPRQVAAMEPRLSEIANEFVDRIDQSKPCELVSQFCVGVPLQIVAEQLRVAKKDMADFKRWSDDAVAVLGNDQLQPDDIFRITKSYVEFSEHFRPILEERRRNPSEDFLGTLIDADDPEFPITDGIRLGLISSMLGAGNETSTKLLGSGAAILARDHALADRLRSEPSLIPAFVEEVIRVEAPVQGLYRTAREDTRLGGVTVPGGSALWVLFGAANRTESEFPQAATINLERPNGRSHVGFGKGTHFCPGASLARMNGFVGFHVLLSRLPNWTINDGAGGVSYERSYVLHGPKTLWVDFEGGQ